MDIVFAKAAHSSLREALGICCTIRLQIILAIGPIYCANSKRQRSINSGVIAELELVEVIGGGFGEANDYASRLLERAAA